MHNIKGMWLALAAGIGLAACNTNASPSFKPNTPLPLVWQADVSSGISRPVAVDGLILLVDESSTLKALDAQTGAMIWQVRLNDAGHDDNPAGVDDGRVFVAQLGDQGKVSAFDVKTGALAWQLPLGNYRNERHPLAAGGRAYFFIHPDNAPSEVRAVDGATGKTLWTFAMQGVSASAFALAGDTLISGQSEWDGPNVKARRLVALDARTGALKWEAPLDLNFAGGISADADRVYAGLDGGVVQARDAATGNALWTARLGGRISAAPTVVNGVVFASNSDGVIAAFNPADGIELWSRHVNSAILTQVAVADGVAYSGTNDGYLFALDAATGAEQWKVRAPEREAIGVGKFIPPMGTTPVVAGDFLLYFNGDALNALKLR